MEEANKNSLKVLMTTDTVGGVWTYCMELCKALQVYKVQCFLVTTGAPMKSWQRKEVEQLHNVDVYETGFALEWMERPWEDIEESSYWLLQLEEDLQPDLIHLNSFCYGALPFKAPVMIVAHSDVWSWWWAVNNNHPPDEWDEYYKRVKDGLNGADLIITPSQSLLKSVQKIYGAAPPHKVIYNGRNKELFSPAHKQNCIMSMGRIWDEAKNIRLLLEAAPYVHATIKLTGEKSMGINELKVDHEKIMYLGQLTVEQVAAQLATTSIYCLPAKYEPFGLSILEAALSGCTLVLGDIDSLQEIWQDNAFYVDTSDAKGLSDTINYLINNNQVRDRYAQKALIHAQKFSTEMFGLQYKQVYRQLVHKSTLIKTEAA